MPSDFSTSPKTHLKVFQTLGHNICPDFIPIDYESSVLCMATHRAGTGSFVVSLVCLFCRQGVASYPLVKGLCGLHGGLVQIIVLNGSFGGDLR